jgi:hypothetical protein
MPEAGYQTFQKEVNNCVYILYNKLVVFDSGFAIRLPDIEGASFYHKEPQCITKMPQCTTRKQSFSHKYTPGIPQDTRHNQGIPNDT